MTDFGSFPSPSPGEPPPLPHTPFSTVAPPPPRLRPLLDPKVCVSPCPGLGLLLSDAVSHRCLSAGARCCLCLSMRAASPPPARRHVYFCQRHLCKQKAAVGLRRLPYKLCRAHLHLGSMRIHAHKHGRSKVLGLLTHLCIELHCNQLYEIMILNVPSSL